MGNWTQTKVRLYSNTGFNASNIPDSQALLNTLSTLDVEAVYIEQERFVSSVKVRAEWEAVKGVDYCRLSYGYEGADTSMYYFVNDIKMVAHDVAMLSLAPDYWTTGDGINGFSILDGITERVHVRDDGYGKWTGDDPLLTPAEPLRIDTVWKYPSNEKETVCVETTLCPHMTVNSKEAISYEDEQGSHSVSVPKAQPNEVSTKYRHSTGDEVSRGTCLYVTQTDVSLSKFPYTGDVPFMNKDIAALRSLGLEQAIVSQTKFPKAYVDLLVDQSDNNLKRGYPITRATGKNLTWTSGINFIKHRCKNNLINYSNLLKYGLMSCSGNGAEFEPADLYHEGLTSPQIRCVTDPNPDGKPYFRFKWVNGSQELVDFWRNCVAGMQWKQVPLMFSGASGSYLNELRYNNNENIQTMRVDMQTKKSENNLINGSGRIAASLPGAISINPLQSLSNGMNIGLDAMKLAQDAEMYQKYQIPLENLNKLSRASDYAISQNVVLPTVNFPYNSEIMRDTYGNGVLVYRYYYSDNDVKRIDKLLTMYGYKVIKPLETDDFKNRRYFNYIKCSDVELGATPDSGRGVRRPRWFLEGAAAQLRGGVRIWHVLPNQSYYNDNPVA